MRSATSSSLRVCAASAICSANSRLLEARVPVDHDRGPRGICTVPLARPAPRPSASAPLYPSASPCIPFPPCILTSASLCIPLPPHLCTRTFARRERSKTPQSLRDTAIAVYSSTRGVPEQAGAAPPEPLPTGNGTATHKWHRHTGATSRSRCHFVAELREMAPLALASVWCSHTASVHTPTLHSKTPQSLRDTAIAVYPSTRGVPEQAGSKSAARRRAPPPLTAHLHSHLCGFTSFVRVLPHTIDANPHSSGS